jgi:hypothetical protein
MEKFHVIHVGTLKKEIYGCNSCSFITAHKGSVYRHFRSHHGDSYKIICPTCKRDFLRKEYLKDHLQSIHHQDISSFPSFIWKNSYGETERDQRCNKTAKPETAKELVEPAQEAGTQTTPVVNWDHMDNVFQNLENDLM